MIRSIINKLDKVNIHEARASTKILQQNSDWPIEIACVIQHGFVHKRSGILGKKYSHFPSWENGRQLRKLLCVKHIKRHVDVDKEHGASKFLCFFNLTTTLAFTVQKTFLDTQDY